MVGSSYQLVQQLCEAVSEANSPAGSSCTIAARIMGQAAGHGGRAAGRGHSGSRQDVSGATLQIWLPTLSQKASFPKHLLVNYGRGSEAGSAGDGAKSAHEETANPARPSALAAESDVLEAMQAECDMVQRLCEEFLARSSGEAPGGDTDQQSRRPEAGSAAPGEGRSYKMPSTLLDAQIATGDAAAALLA
eukprot:jgi/Tetstr1/424732/TSEL_015250.t1